MKFKGMMLVTLVLLAILTIGAVSASDDVTADDNLAASDITDTPIEEAPVDDVIAETPEEPTGVVEDDFNVWVTNKTLDLDNDKEEVVITFDSPQGADGEFNIFVNGMYKKDIVLSNETLGQRFNVTLNELSISASGDFSVQIKYFPNNGDNLIFDAGTLTAVKYYSADDFDTTTYDDVRDVKNRAYSFSRVPALGTLVMYVNGVEQYRKYIDDKNPYLQLYVGDLNITENGLYNIRSEYIVAESGQVISIDDFNTDVICMPVTIVLSSLDINLNAGYKMTLATVYDNDGVLGTITAYLDDEQVFNRVVSDSPYSVSIDEYTLPENFALGNHTVKIVYLKGGKEYRKEGNLTFYAEPEITSPGYTITVGDKKYFTVKYYKGSTGTMVVYNTVKDSTASAGWKKGTVFMTVNLNGNGTATVPLESLDVGYHGFCFNITLGTYSVEKYMDVNVAEAQDPRPDPGLTINVDDIKFGNDATISITTNESFTGIVLVEIGEISINVTVKNGVGTGKVSNLNASQYMAEAFFEATEAFKKDYAYDYFTVEPIWSTVIVSVDGKQDYEYDLGCDDTLNLTVTTTGAIGFIAKLDGNNATVDGNIIRISDLGVGTHNLDISSIPDSNHKADSVLVVINVAKSSSSIIVDDNVDVIKGGSTINVTTVGAKGITAKIGEVTLPVNGNVIEIPASFDVGTYKLAITTVPDENHTAATKEVTVTVKKYQSAVSLSSNNLTFDYNKSTKCEVTFDNATGIKAEIDGYTNVVSVEGNVITVANLTPGNYVLKVTTVVDDAHESATATANVTVNKLKTGISVDDKITFDYKSSASTQVISDAKLKAEIPGITGAVVTIVDGVLTVSGLNAGNYTLVISTDDELYEPVTKDVSVIVNKIATGISLKDNNITFDYGSSGSTQVSSDANLKGEVSGQPKATVTIKDGVITVSGLACGNYTLVISTDDANYEPASANVNVTVNQLPTSISATKVTTTYGTSKTMTVTLKSNDNPVAGKKVTVVINGKTLTGTTNEKGQASITVPNNLAVKNSYAATVTFAGDENYTQSTVKTSVVVNKATPKFVYKTAVTLKRTDKNKKYTVTLKTDKNTVYKNAKVTIKVNGKTYSGKTNTKGQYTFKLTKLTKKGKFTATLKFVGDAKYKAISKSVKITVK